MAALSRKLREWLLRYGPAELASLALTVAGGWAAGLLTHSRFTIALAATGCGNIGYFGQILLQDVIRTRKESRLAGRPYTPTTFLKNIRALVVEFGIAEVLDSFLIRPFLLYKMPQLTGGLTSGLIAGKFLADVTFYVPAIFFYEWSKMRFRKF